MSSYSPPIYHILPYHYWPEGYIFQLVVALSQLLQPLRLDLRLFILLQQKIMYSQFTSSCPLYDKYTSKNDSKRPLSTYYDPHLPNQKPSLAKNLRWNIEECKQNCSTDTTPPPSSAVFNHDQYSTSIYPNKFTLSQGYEHSLKQSKKSKGSKSYKTINFSNDFQREYQKDKSTFEKDNSLFKNRQNLKQSYKVGYQDSLNAVGSAYYRPESSYKSEQPGLKKMKSCKSEKRIGYDWEERVVSKSPLFKLYNLDKPKEELKPVNPYSNKSCSNIKLDLVRPKMDKMTSYNDLASTQSVEKVYSKKHQTLDINKIHQQIDMKHSSSASHCPPQRQRICLADFELGKCKGEGAFGQVFPAVHKQTRMLVAIKKVPKEKVKFMLPQFISEIKIQMFLDHPNIVKLYGFFDDATNFYIIMEFMEGGNLFGLVKKKKKLTEAETVEKLKEICLGLKEMHDNSILHRDIKPENIVITNDVSKLCDFGWAAVCKDRRTTYCGTLDYVSPEIIEGEGYDDSVDIWCIGVLAYELICGKTPFYNISRKQTMKRIRDVHYDYPNDISVQAKAFIDKILKKNPDERISIEQVLKDRFLNP